MSFGLCKDFKKRRKQRDVNLLYILLTENISQKEVITSTLHLKVFTYIYNILYVKIYIMILEPLKMFCCFLFFPLDILLSFCNL